MANIEKTGLLSEEDEAELKKIIDDLVDVEVKTTDTK